MIDHIGDILAIPFFAWLSYYFYNLPQRTTQETILFIFSVGGLIADLVFTLQFARQLHSTTVNLFIVMYFILAILVFHNSLGDQHA
jgi:uncharacterized membrane protein (DUF106 family)